jgi:hypothetical protein
MLKNILKLKGTQKLTKNEQKNINGGYVRDLSNVCGPYKFSSTQSQCLTMYAGYSPIWLGNGYCSVIGNNC